MCQDIELKNDAGEWIGLESRYEVREYFGIDPPGDWGDDADQCLCPCDMEELAKAVNMRAVQLPWGWKFYKRRTKKAKLS